VRLWVAEEHEDKERRIIRAKRMKIRKEGEIIKRRSTDL
jgi:hypothetical protein